MKYRGFTLIELILGIFILGVFAGIASMAAGSILGANANMFRKLEAERQVDVVLGRVGFVIRSAAAADPVSAATILGTNYLERPFDNLIVPNDVWENQAFSQQAACSLDSLEVSSCQNLRVTQRSLSGRLRDIDMATSCASTGNEKSPISVMCPQTTLDSPTTAPVFSVSSHLRGEPESSRISEVFPGSKGSFVKSMAVCFHVCRPLTENGVPYRPPESIAVDVTGIYRLPSGAPKSFTKRRIFNLYGNSKSVVRLLSF